MGNTLKQGYVIVISFAARQSQNRVLIIYGVPKSNLYGELVVFGEFGWWRLIFWHLAMFSFPFALAISCGSNWVRGAKVSCLAAWR